MGELFSEVIEVCTKTICEVTELVLLPWVSLEGGRLILEVEGLFTEGSLRLFLEECIKSNNCVFPQNTKSRVMNQS